MAIAVPRPRRPVLIVASADQPLPVRAAPFQKTALGDALSPRAPAGPRSAATAEQRLPVRARPGRSSLAGRFQPAVVLPATAVGLDALLGRLAAARDALVVPLARAAGLFVRRSGLILIQAPSCAYSSRE